MREIKKIIKNETERKYIEVPVEKEYYECSDGKVFDNERIARFHQIDLDKEVSLNKIHENIYILRIDTKRTIDKDYIEYIENIIQDERMSVEDMIKIENKNLLPNINYLLTIDIENLHPYCEYGITAYVKLIPIEFVTSELRKYL